MKVECGKTNELRKFKMHTIVWCESGLNNITCTKSFKDRYKLEETTSCTILVKK